MRNLTSIMTLVFLLSGFLLLMAADSPEKIIFESKMGKVTYLHAKHADREKGDCKVCHDKLFPQSKAPLNYKAAMHKTAEKAKSSCGACHVAGGTAFASTGACAKCHVKG
jgi:c(7)-type cytochrome triheme protein